MVLLDVDVFTLSMAYPHVLLVRVMGEVNVPVVGGKIGFTGDGGLDGPMLRLYPVGTLVSIVMLWLAEANAPLAVGAMLIPRVDAEEDMERVGEVAAKPRPVMALEGCFGRKREEEMKDTKKETSKRDPPPQL